MLPNFSLCFHARPSCGTDNAKLSFQQLIPYPERWRMAQSTTVEVQVSDIVRRAGACDLEEITRQCANLTWNQVFLAVDRLSRRGEILLMPRGRGFYTVTFPYRQDGRPNQLSLPS